VVVVSWLWGLTQRRQQGGCCKCPHSDCSELVCMCVCVYKCRNVCRELRGSRGGFVQGMVNKGGGSCKWARWCVRVPFIDEQQWIAQWQGDVVCGCQWAKRRDRALGGMSWWYKVSSRSVVDEVGEVSGRGGGGGIMDLLRCVFPRYGMILSRWTRAGGRGMWQSPGAGLPGENKLGQG
jgi:hypothetical protein